MQKLISKYGLAAHLALVVVAPLFLSPVAVIWLSVLAAIWLLMEPSRLGNETLHEARRRVVGSIVRDPVFWVTLFLIVVSVVRMLNDGVALAYDAEVGKWSVSDAQWPLLPSSTEASGFPLVGCAVAVCVAVQGCRHCLGRSARGMFALLSSALSGLGAFVLAYLQQEGVAAAVAAVGIPLTEPVYAGCTYGIFLSSSIVALTAVFEAQWFKSVPLALLGIAGNALGLFIFAPAAMVVLHAGAALVVFLYAFVYMRIRMGRTSEFKFLVLFGMSLALTVLAVQGMFSKSFVEERLAPFVSCAFVPDGYLESRDTLSEIAVRVWKSAPWLGYGHGSFPVVLQYNATPADWQVVTPLQNAIPNGYWMLLTERGVVGAFFLAVLAVLLMITYVRRLVFGVTRSLPHPLAWVGFLIAVVAALETLFDASYLAPGAAVALVVVFSLSAAAFPKEMSSHG